MPKTLNEIRYGMKTVGPPAKLPTLQGVELTILAFSLFESEFAPGACVQCSAMDKDVWFVTFSEFVIETLKMMQAHMPYTTMPTVHESGTGRTYITLE